jgi:hypothetical protein
MSKQNNTPPPWLDIRSQFSWLAQDEDGGWYAYSSKPKARTGKDIPTDFGYWGDGGLSSLVRWDDPNPNWIDTLQKRPDDE